MFQIVSNKHEKMDGIIIRSIEMKLFPCINFSSARLDWDKLWVTIRCGKASRWSSGKDRLKASKNITITEGTGKSGLFSEVVSISTFGAM